MRLVETHILFSTMVLLLAAFFAVFFRGWKILSGCFFCGILERLKCGDGLRFKEKK